MSSGIERNSIETAATAGSGTIPTAPDEFLSLRDILVMILRRRRALSAFVILITLAAGILFISLPKEFKAEGYLQVIAPVSKEGRVDRELYETMIVSHLQKVASAFIAKNVAELLTNKDRPIEPLVLEKKVKITRPPKTNLIRLVVTDKAADRALLIVRLWVREYLATVQINNIHSALSQTRLLLQQAQGDLMEKQTTVDNLRTQVAQTSPLITLSRAVDDRQLWGDLAQTATPPPEALKKLAEIHIKGQEQSEEYIFLKNSMVGAEQALSAAVGKRNLYREAARILEARIAANNYLPDAKAAPTNATEAEAEIYVETLVKSSDIVQFGEPGLLSAGRGALKKTAAVFLASLALASCAAFLREWGKGLLSGR